jgi:gliding motility-associated-like protein
MKILIYKILALLVLMVSIPVLCVAAVPQSKAFIVISSINGEKDSLYAGDAASNSFEAPLEVSFFANMNNVDTGTSIFPEWRVNRQYMEGNNQRQQEYLLRQEENPSYTINDFGTYTVKFAYSYRPAGVENTVEGEDLDVITFSIDDSEMKVPNAFSPNGDGINDLFKVKVHSIVSFKMSIFNRWGQLIKSGTQDNLEYEGDTGGGYYICWDGMRNGEAVGDGVYYIRIEAIGAGGKKYDKRSDINVLKGTGIE